MDFYERVIRQLLKSRDMTPEDAVLVVCGGPYDARVLRAAGFRRVTITNLDAEMNTELASFAWSQQDAEQLLFDDNSFDWAIVNAGLHHCASPHRGLLELCRVARKGVLAMEARDSALIRLAVKLGLTVDYETEAVALADYQGGGLRNSSIPNYIYRWTEREVKKTVESAYPQRRNDIRFFYQLRIPLQRLTMSGAWKRALVMFLGGCANIFQLVFPRQCNEFGFAILNSNSCKPWIVRNRHGFALDRDFRLRYDPSKYRP